MFRYDIFLHTCKEVFQSYSQTPTTRSCAPPAPEDPNSSQLAPFFLSWLFYVFVLFCDPESSTGVVYRTAAESLFTSVWTSYQGYVTEESNLSACPPSTMFCISILREGWGPWSLSPSRSGCWRTQQHADLVHRTIEALSSRGQRSERAQQHYSGRGLRSGSRYPPLL